MSLGSKIGEELGIKNNNAVKGKENIGWEGQVRICCRCQHARRKGRMHIKLCMYRVRAGRTADYVRGGGDAGPDS